MSDMYIYMPDQNSFELSSKQTKLSQLNGLSL